MHLRTALAALLLAAPGLPRAAPLPASVTISGGVSLGAYEAGLTYYALEALRANPGMTEVKMATGASAGSVNGFIALLESCGPAAPDPRESLFWKTWIPLGLDQLTQLDGTGPTAAFSRTAFATPLGLIARTWAEGLRADCDVVFGVSVTRLRPRLVSLKGDRLRLPRVEEHFVVRVQGRGPGRPPRLTNYADPAWEGEQPLLVEGPDGEVAFPALVDALFASTAFPGAFPPQAVRHCVVRGGTARWPGCPEASAVSDLFVDGGVFDNTPIRLASGRVAAGLRIVDGKAGWIDRPELGRHDVPASTVFTYVSPDVRTFPPADKETAAQLPKSLLGVTAEVGSTFYDGARAKNLLYLHDEDPEFFDRLVIPERHLPAASSPLGAFFGFFETGLRTFDFTLGMYDARRMAQARLASRLARAGRTDPVRLPEQLPAAAAAAAAASWQPYRCLSAVMDDPPAAEAACQGEALRDFRAVLQTSIERLWDRCAGIESPSGVFADDPLCRASADGQPPRPVPGVEQLPRDAWRRGAEENEVAYTLRLLSAHRFEFKDLGLRRDQSDEAPARLRQRLLQVGSQVARSQPGGEATMVETAVKLGADQVIYVPPRYVGWVVFGRDIEAGLSVGFSGAAGAIAATRLHAALQVNNTARALSSEKGSIGVSALVGLEVLPASWASSALQPSLVLRGGLLLSSEDDFGTASCPDPDSSVVGSCTRPTVGLGVTATALERVRLQVFFNYYPGRRSGGPDWWAVSPALGVQWPF